MLRVLNVLMGLGFLFLAAAVYQLEHRIRASERQIGELNAAMAVERDYMKMLDAEWAGLSSPERIGKLVQLHLPELVPLSPQQLVTLDGLEAGLSAGAPRLPGSAPAGDDPIGDMLKVLR
jgi:hypothetical protein